MDMGCCNSFTRYTGRVRWGGGEADAYIYLAPGGNTPPVPPLVMN